MRVHLGAIPSSPDFEAVTPWKSLREPTPWLAQLIALPIGVVAGLVVTALWFAFTPLRDVTPTTSMPAVLI